MRRNGGIYKLHRGEEREGEALIQAEVDDGNYHQLGYREEECLDAWVGTGAGVARGRGCTHRQEKRSSHSGESLDRMTPAANG